MATARMAAGSLMETVSNTAQMLSSTVNVMADSVNMLGGFVSKHRTMQAQRTIVELDNFQNRLIEETTMENVKRHEKIEEYVTANDTRRTKWNAEYERLTKLLNPNAQAQPSEA